MNSLQDNQSDLEVIMDFLEEYYRQNRDNGLGNLDDVYWTTSVSVDDPSCEHQHFTCHETLNPKPVLLQPILKQESDVTPSHIPATVSGPWVLNRKCDPDDEQGHHTAIGRSAAHTSPGTGRKTRLFHFLFEMLEDPAMAHCVSWVPAAANSTGVFRFSSGNKDQVAALWGQRKGNKRPMTYQKMSRALRNYARSGEIFKVKRKLTYQFGQDTLQSLQQCRHGRH
ncbi:transcription factor Spi-B [Gadus morhua]|uniref:transcription factor Spi-B n=1 Tax=Gadus morhua TaxID=8049 RepID=UPI0011B4ACEC|nr:transcription factor Spi-B-like [Gadus morhua]